jgi:nucleoside 2-deoxyribosyltransferase
MEKKVYLAGPFFNEEQKWTMSKIETMCHANRIDFFSPRLECLCAPDAPEAQRRGAYQANVDNIEAARFVLARIDDFDPGTMWEMGYAKGLKPSIRTYAFTTVENRGLNLMLAMSGVKLIQGWGKLQDFLGGDDNAAIVWRKEII